MRKFLGFIIVGLKNQRPGFGINGQRWFSKFLKKKNSINGHLVTNNRFKKSQDPNLPYFKEKKTEITIFK